MDLEELFASVGCAGSVCALEIHGPGRLAFHADERVVPASVIKVPLALTALEAFDDGSLDPQARIQVEAAGRTPGPTGMSLYEDDVELSARDLVNAALTISDNAAADALLDLISVERVNAFTRHLGLAGTRLAGTLRETIDSIGRDAGFNDYPGLLRFWADAPDPAEASRVRKRIAACAPLDPQRGSHTTADDMAQLMKAVWRDHASTPAVCSRVRQLMGQQLTRHRIASGFDPEVEVAAKSGGLMGVVRNEIGVVTFPDGGTFAVAVFTRSVRGHDEREINSAIGRAAAVAIDGSRGGDAARRNSRGDGQSASECMPS